MTPRSLGWRSWLGLEAQLCQHVRRTAVPARHRHVAHVAKILYAHLAREKSSRRHVAHPGKERDAMTELRLCFRRPGDVIQHLTTLGITRLEKRLAVAKPANALGVEPREA